MADVPPETMNEQTMQLDNLVQSIKRLEDKSEAAARKRVVKTRKPLAWSAALVLIVTIVCGLGAWVAYLAMV